MKNKINLHKTNNKFLIGMVYLPAMPSYPNYLGFEKNIEIILNEILIYQELGIKNILLENEFDKPHLITAPESIINEMSRITKSVVNKFPRMKVGVEFLLNDPKASITIAKDGGAHFIRTDYFVDEMERLDLNIKMDIDPIGLIKHREKLNAKHINIFADIQVKYAHMTTPRPLINSAIEAQKMKADGIIISATKTGEAVDPNDLNMLNFKNNYPIFIGSGLNSINLKQLLPLASGAIIGTSFLTNGRVDKEKVLNFLTHFRELN